MRERAQAALRMPFNGRGWPRKFAIGAATTLAAEALFAALGYLASGEAGLGLAPLAVAVNFPLLGYALEVFRGGLAGGAEVLPEWASWGALVSHGLLLALVGLGYALLPLVMLLIGVNFLVRGGIMLSMAVSLIVLGLLAGLAILFFLPMGVARYLVEERIEAAFRPAGLWAAIARVLGEYVAVYASAIALLLVVGVVASVPWAGPLLTPLLAFYFTVVQARLIGEVCGRARAVPAA